MGMAMISSWIPASRVHLQQLLLIVVRIEEADVVGNRPGQELVVLHRRANHAARDMNRG